MITKEIEKNAGGSTDSPLPSFRRAGNAISACCTALALLLAEPATAASALEQAQARTRDYLHQQFAEEARRQGWRGAQLHYDSVELGSSRQLPACPETPGLERLDDGRGALGRQRLQLSCPSRPDWRVNLLVSVGASLPVLVAERPIERGQSLQSGQFRERQRDLAKLPKGFFQDAEQFVGEAARRRIRPGQVLTPALVAAKPLVRRGQIVTIVASQAGIEASARGEALSEGRRGELIRVRNSRSDKIIEAKVVGKALVSSQLGGTRP